MSLEDGEALQYMIDRCSGGGGASNSGGGGGSRTGRDVGTFDQQRSQNVHQTTAGRYCTSPERRS